MTVRVRHKNPNALSKLFNQYRQNYVVALGFPVGTSSVSTMYPSKNADRFKRLKGKDIKTNKSSKKPAHEGVTVNKDNTSSGGSSGSISVLEVAAMNEFGTSKIPARPFIKLSKPKLTERSNKLIRPLVKKLNKGAITKKGIGEILANKLPNIIKKTITDLRDPPNAELTILLKRSANPLIDTTLMRSLVTGVVRKESNR